jgi:Mn-dependent DtxR family transcriptional regulator
MSEVEKAATPYYATIKKVDREREVIAFTEMWLKTFADTKDGQAVCQALRESVAKGYLRMGPDGTLVLTEKGAWREVERAKKGGK